MGSIAFPEAGSRDADTFRAVIKPDVHDLHDVDADAVEGEALERDPKWPFVLSIVVGAFIGVFVICWAYVQDHPSVPTAARNSVAAMQRPSAPPPPAVNTTIAPDNTPSLDVGFGVRETAPVVATFDKNKRAKTRTQPAPSRAKK
jgi:hypothetical protein